MSELPNPPAFGTINRPQCRAKWQWSSECLDGQSSLPGLTAKLKRLRLEAEDCQLTAKLSPDLKKRAFFAKLSVQLKAMVRDIEETIAARARANDHNAAQGRLM